MRMWVEYSGKKYLKKLSVLMKQHFVSTKLAKIKKEQMLPGKEVWETLIHCWWECKWDSHFRKQFSFLKS